MTGSRWFTLSVRDTVLVRDGRSFEAAGGRAGADQARGVAPWPSTVAGALGSAFFRDTGSRIEPAAVRGPLLARQDASGSWTPYFATPADVVLGASHRPLRSPLARRLGLLEAGNDEPAVLTDLHGLAESLLVASGDEQVEPAGGWLSATAMTDYLAGLDDTYVPLPPQRWVRPEEDPLVQEARIGLARDGTVAREGYLYAATHLRPRLDWALLVQCVDSHDSMSSNPRGCVPLGGKARLADLAVADGVDWPDAPDTFPEGQVLLYVATPALWPGGWRPPLPPHVDIVAASLGEPVAVATASARTARQRSTSILDTATLRWAVPAGSVYWLRVRAPHSDPHADPASVAARWVSGIHATALGPALDPAGSHQQPGTPGTDRTATAGFGVVLLGRWPGPVAAAAPEAPTVVADTASTVHGERQR